MTPEERANEAFAAYLGSINGSEEMWRTSQQSKARRMAKMDALLDAVAENEKIQASAEELENAYKEAAEKWELNVEVIKEQVDAFAINWQIKRDKARRLIIESAVRS